MAKVGLLAILLMTIATLAIILLALPKSVNPEAGIFAVEVHVPSGELGNGTMHAQRGTPFGALLALAQRESWQVVATGRGESLIVTGVNEWYNEGAGGWCFDVAMDSGWLRPALGADAYALAAGQAVRWVYETNGCGTLG